MVRKTLLFAGVLASLLYVASNIFVPLGWKGYSSMAQTVSELSAIGAPTRPIWIPFGILYALLMFVFGYGVVTSAGDNRRLGIAGILLSVYALVCLVWPLAPMHQRGEEPTFTDTMHIVFAAVTVLLMLTAIGFAATALGKTFRVYSLITMMLLLAFGVLTALDAPKLAANLPTPLIGLW